MKRYQVRSYSLNDLEGVENLDAAEEYQFNLHYGIPDPSMKHEVWDMSTKPGTKVGVYDTKDNAEMAADNLNDPQN